MNNQKTQSSPKKSGVFAFGILLIVSFMLIVAASTIMFGNYKTDFTKDKRNTISQGTKEIIKNLKEPIFINVYLSSSLSQEYPQYAQYAQYVLRYLNRYKNLSNGLINIEVKNPEPYSLEEEDAKNNGIQGFLDAKGKFNLYFGATFSNNKGEIVTIPNFLELRKNYLEADISRILVKLSEYERKTVGIASPTIRIASKNSSLGDSQEWGFVKQLRKDYDIVDVSTESVEIPLDVDVLVLFNPQKLSNLFIYALDQFVIRGGRLLIMLDPYFELESDTGVANPYGPKLDKLLNNWGVKYIENTIVGDNNMAQTIRLDNNQNEQLKKYMLWMSLTSEAINNDSIISKGISNLNLRSAGALEIISSKEAVITSLLTTTTQSGSVPAHIAKYTDKANTISLYKETGKQYNLGVLIEGNFKSIFDENIIENTKFVNDILPYLTSSLSPTKIIILSDSDMLVNSNWLHDEYSNTTSPYGFVSFNDNYDYIQRSIDYLADNNDFLMIQKKNLRLNNKAVNDLIYEDILAKNKSQYDDLTTKLSSDNLALEKIKQSIAKKESSMDIKTIKEVEQLQRSISINQENLKHLEYKMQQENNNKVSFIIIVNTVVFPVLLVGLIWLLKRFAKKKAQKKVMELINEHKNA